MNTNYKIRILIAEDEPIILNNIEKKAKKAGDWVVIAGKAESGSEALTLLETCSADILITDIEMPGMNGLDLIRQVREQYPAMKIVILSGYSSFEYAQTALRFGVNDYLLKPVPQETFNELLLKLRTKIIQESSTRKREILSQALNNSSANTEAPSDLKEGTFYLLYLLIGNYAGPSIQPAVSEEYLTIRSRINLEDCLKKLTGINHIWEIEETYPLSVFFILHADSDISNMGYLQLLLQKYLAENLPDLPFLMLIYSDSIPYKKIWDASKFLRETAAQYSRPFQQDIWFSNKIPDECIKNSGFFTHTFSVLHNLTGMSAFLQYVENVLEEILQNKYPSQVFVKFLSEVFSYVNTYFLAESTVCRNTLSSILSDFYRYPDSSSLKEKIIQQLTSLLERDSISTSGENLCTKITQYIQNNYCSRLSLNDLADYFGYTASYINRIFKKELGLSPLQYITDLKIQRAKELLRSDTGMDIKEIAACIGYEDARYFSRVFKNETGMTPTAWINSEKKNT